MFGKKSKNEDEKKKKGFFRRLKLIVILAVVGSVVLGAMNVREPDTEVTDIKKVELSGGNITLTLVIEVDNPNLLGATLTDVDTIVYIDGNKIGPATNDKEFNIDGRGKSEIEVKLTVEGVGLGNEIQVKGTVTVKLFTAISFEQDIDKTKQIVS